MLNKIFKNHFKLITKTVDRFIQVIMLMLWIANLLSLSLSFQNTDSFSSHSDVPIHTLIDYDLTAPEKLYHLQNETKRITENLKVQPLGNLNLAVLSKTDLHHKTSHAISTEDDTALLSYILIETTNPRSPPASFI